MDWVIIAIPFFLVFLYFELSRWKAGKTTLSMTLREYGHKYPVIVAIIFYALGMVTWHIFACTSSQVYQP